jgi:hypothetical protein
MLLNNLQQLDSHTTQYKRLNNYVIIRFEYGKKSLKHIPSYTEYLLNMRVYSTIWGTNVFLPT